MVPALPWSVRGRAAVKPALLLAVALVGLVVGNPLVRGTPGESLALVAFVLAVGLAAGRLAELLGMPRLTGHLLAGVAMSPGLAEVMATASWFVDPQQVRSLAVVNDLAVGVIALMAGSEIQARWLRHHGRRVATVVGMLLLLVPGAVLALLALPWLVPGLPTFPFLLQAQAEGVSVVVVAVLAAVVMVANGPTVVVGVIRELDARGPLAQTLLAASVVLDAAVVVLVTVLLACLDPRAETGVGRACAEVSVALVSSLAVGGAVGWGLRQWAERQPQHLVWAVLAAALAVATAGVHAGIKPLFCLMAAGVAFGNVSLLGGDPEVAHRRLHQALGQLGTPVFAIFFVVAGLSVQVVPLLTSAALVVTLLAVRDGGIFAVTRWAGRLAGLAPAVRRDLWTGMTTQAGVTLALAGLVSQHHPGWGATLATVVVALVTVHEMWCPVVLARALRREGA